MLIFAIRAWKGLKAAWQWESHTESSGGNTAEDVEEQHQAGETPPLLVTLHH